VAFDARGHAFLVYIGMDNMSNKTRNGEYLQRSVDGGRTWEAPIPLIEQPEGNEPIFNHIAHVVADNDPASPYAGRIYALWNRNLAQKNEIMLARSTDDGKTWSQPRAISTAGNLESIAVSQDGTLYAMYSFWDPSEKSPSWDRDWKTELAVSHDGGETFGDRIPAVQASSRPNPNPNSGCNAYQFPRGCGWPVMALDPRRSGRLFIVWGDYRYGDRDIFSATSDDGGRTWSSAVRVNDDPRSNGRDQLMQGVAVDPTDGAAYILFYDRRGDPKNLLPTVTLARSADGGRTFTNYAWSDTRSDPKQACLGDYIGLAAQNGRVYGAWVENMPREQKASQKPPQKVVSGDMMLDERWWPFGPSAIRIGMTVFPTTAAATRQVRP
jgi:hypothetical protein